MIIMKITDLFLLLYTTEYHNGLSTGKKKKIPLMVTHCKTIIAQSGTVMGIKFKKRIREKLNNTFTYVFN